MLDASFSCAQELEERFVKRVGSAGTTVRFRDEVKHELQALLGVRLDDIALPLRSS